jgi:hypothetical protein
MVMSTKMWVQEKIKFSKEHLAETNWTYKQHLDHSFMQSNRLIKMAIKSYLHGIFPWLYKGDGPIGIYKIYREIKKIQHVQKMFKELDEDEKH